MKLGDRMEPLEIRIEASQVSGLLLITPHGQVCFVFAHGAGAGMAHIAGNIRDE